MRSNGHPAGEARFFLSLSDLGAHVSVAGGLETCFRRAREIGASAIQIFVKNQRQWAARPLAPAAVTAFRAARRRDGGPRDGVVVAHATYLVNLAATDETIFSRSVATLAEELRRAETLGLLGLIVHPGSSPAGREAGIARMSLGLERAMTGSRAALILEGTAGGGRRLGARFEDLRAIIDSLPARLAGRTGVCIDTCHLHAAGYPVSSAGGLDATLDEFDAVVGLDRLWAIHVNDSKGAFGSRLDRHAHLGEGTIGLAGFEALVNSRRLAGVPKILETDPEGGGQKRDLALLRAMRRGGWGKGKGDGNGLGHGHEDEKERKDGISRRKRASVRGKG